MKKILTILAAVGLTATTGTTLVSCGSGQKNNDQDYTNVSGVTAWNNNLKQVQGFVIDQIGTTFESSSDMNEKIKTINFSKVARKNILFADNLALGEKQKDIVDEAIKKAPNPNELFNYSIYVVAVRSSTKRTGTNNQDTLKVDYLEVKDGEWTYATFDNVKSFKYENVFVSYKK
ncbi:lipoprotein [Mesoplasma tabanidae]|uniref:Lipoprotein n=1 Tax=Mesoplasma tabanidae TaxID=219745 RepID=A0A2K8P397_9MOLU|nr:lipoprotein [Mesoplasma tabanidae]ATZ21227.1 hypothetical protein MTABA_v1c00190 [Mesoplasma tabanidae]